MHTSAQGPRIEAVTLSDTLVLRFMNNYFNREQILEKAASARLAFDKALVVMAERRKIISIEDLQKRYRSLNKLKLNEWENDGEVKSYIEPKGRAIESDYPMVGGRLERAEAFRKKRDRINAEADG